MMRSSLLSVILCSGLLLASCNSAPGTGGGSTGMGNDGQRTGNTATTGTPGMVSRTVTLGLPGNPSAEVLVPGTLASRVTAQLESAPAGLTVTVGTPTQLNTGDVSIPVSYAGDAPADSVVKVKLTVAGRSSSAELPVIKFSSRPIQAGGLNGTYSAASMEFLPDGRALLTSTQSGDVTARHGLVEVDATGSTFTLLNLPVITQFGDAITSQATAPDGTTWMTVRGMTTEGSYLLSRDPAGNVNKYLVGATGDNVNSATLAAGQVWFTQYTHAALKALTPEGSSVQSYLVPEKADSLVRGADGNLYYASLYARPALAQFNPASGRTRLFNVGEANRSLPTSLRGAPDGSVWFLESVNSAVWRLDPVSGQQTQLALPAGATPDSLALGPSGQVWVSDATNARLYTSLRLPSGSSALVGVNTPQGGAHALTISPAGKAWFEAGGNLYVQQ